LSEGIYVIVIETFKDGEIKEREVKRVIIRKYYEIEIISIRCSFICFSNSILSQNVLSIGSRQVNVSTKFELAVSLDNTNEIAVQFDMSYDGTEFELLSEHSLTNRASNHSFGINSLSENKLRIIIYSSETRILSGNSGVLFGLKLKSKNNPGDFQFTLSNVVFILVWNSFSSSVQNGSVNVLGSKNANLTNEVNFGKVLYRSGKLYYYPKSWKYSFGDYGL
jgi:hypothetical protein